jgi:hypothetical protein
MPETVNTDVAQELSDRNEGRHKERWERVAEIVEVLFLAIVATATAWSGYQAAKWDGRESALYQDATRDRFLAEAASTVGGLELVSDSALFTAWLQARADHDAALQHEFENRFTSDFREDFDAWVDGSGDQDVDFMPGYDRNPHVEEATRLNAQSAAAFAKGKDADVVADNTCATRCCWPRCCSWWRSRSASTGVGSASV